MTAIEQAEADRKRIADELQAANKRLETLQNEEREKRLEPLKALTIKCHDALCRWNHTDGCGWGYEVNNGVHNWQGWAHARWLKHIDEIVNPGKYASNPPVSIEVIEKLIDTVLELKKIDPNAMWIIRNQLEPK